MTVTDDYVVADKLPAEDLRTCAECGNPFEYAGGRGRPPSRCPDCRPSPRESRSKGTRGPKSTLEEETPPRRPRAIESLERTLHTQLTMLGGATMLLDVFDGQVIVRNAEQGAKVLANLAQTNPKIRRALERGVEAAGWGPVVLWAVTTSLPILAHHGVIRGVPDPARSGPAPTPFGANGFDHGVKV